MKISIYGETYYINMTKVGDTLKKRYLEISGKPIVLRNGKTIDLSRKSLPLIAARATMVQTILPMIEDMYTDQGIPLPPHVKHENVVDYIVNAILDLMIHIEGKVHFYVTSEPDKSGVEPIHIIKSVPTTRSIERAVSERSTSNTET